jgi:hypothetical protein
MTRQPASIPITLEVYTALWTHEDVAFGANDPTKTTSEELTFDTLDELIQYLRDSELTEPSSWPVQGNETRVWYSEPSRLITDEELSDGRYYRTAHRTDTITDQQWIEVVTRMDTKY